MQRRFVVSVDLAAKAILTVELGTPPTEHDHQAVVMTTKMEWTPFGILVLEEEYMNLEELEGE